MIGDRGLWQLEAPALGSERVCGLANSSGRRLCPFDRRSGQRGARGRGIVSFARGLVGLWLQIDDESLAHSAGIASELGGHDLEGRKLTATLSVGIARRIRFLLSFHFLAS